LFGIHRDRLAVKPKLQPTAGRNSHRCSSVMLSIVSQSRCPSPRSLLRLLAWTTVAVAFFVVPATADTAPEVHTNRLIDSASPYLLLHAHNPVDWYPWGKEAIGKARKENKLIFLSIGYSTCYWCHVAERTIYSVPAIATLMNQWFVNIKVDREERPDLDASFWSRGRL
jgi:uncharacterized membrane protein